MKSMNLSKFKKISTDEKTTTLQHPDGHHIKIVHAVLKPELKVELDKLPIHKSNGGSVKRYADGSPETVSNDDQKMRAPAQLNSIEDIKNMLLGKTLSDQAQPKEGQPAPQQQAPQPDQSQQVGTPAVPTPPAVQQEAPPTDESDQEQTSPQSNAGLAAQSAPQPENPVTAATQPQVPQETMDATANPTAPTVANAEEQAPYRKAYNDYVQEHMAEHAQEDAAFQHDLTNGHITPQTYSSLFSNKGTLGKIGMIFGMMASGAGSGLSHQPNAMLSLMNNEIQNDLEAQKQSKSNAQNYLRIEQANKKIPSDIALTGAQANLAQANANMQSTLVTNMRMNRVAAQHLVDEMNKLPVGSPQRIQQERALAMLYPAINSENNTLSARAAAAGAYYNMLMNSGSNNGNQSNEESFQNRTNGMRLLGPQGQEMAKNAEEKHFPGLKGQASMPLTSEDRNAMNSGMEFDQKLHRFMDWTKNHSGDLTPSDRKAGQAMAAELQGAYRQATHGGVYKEGEQNFISKIIDSNPTKFFNEVRVMPQLKTVANENQSRVNQLVKSKGFSGYQSPASAEPQYKISNGVKYMRGPNGEAVRVK